MSEKDKLKEKVSGLPELPGVYIYRDSGGRIIYIGKAKNLKKRVRSYFTRYLSGKTQALVARIKDIEYILTPTEFQAQLLEAALVKEKQPQYNIDLKDDKSFPLVKITDEEFPSVTVCRQRELSKKKEKAFYYGPYQSAWLLREALGALRKIFGFRTCRTLPKKTCLYFRLNLCPGPCCGKISVKDYRALIGNIKLFLDSKYDQLIDKLSRDMQLASRLQRYEEAAKLRDSINALSSIGRSRRNFSSIYELEDLQKLLGLKKLPLRIEGFDISNLSGKEATAAMVSFYKGVADKNNYRRFRIRTVDAIDDYAMMREAVARRYSRLVRENKPLPDLILIDGGKQHLLAAQGELEKLGLDIPITAIAKVEENVYIKDKAGPIQMTEDTPALNLIRRIRDEAHRFCRKYHHLLRKKKILPGL
jgi:excinuclease ABC subunit C